MDKGLPALSPRERRAREREPRVLLAQPERSKWVSLVMISCPNLPREDLTNPPSSRRAPLHISGIKLSIKMIMMMRRSCKMSSMKRLAKVRVLWMMTGKLTAEEFCRKEPLIEQMSWIQCQISQSWLNLLSLLMQRSAKRKKRNKSWPICSIKAPKVAKRRSSSTTTWLLLCDKEGRGVKLGKD